MKEFCYFGDLLDSEGGVERTVRIRLPQSTFGSVFYAELDQSLSSKVTQ